MALGRRRRRRRRSRSRRPPWRSRVEGARRLGGVEGRAGAGAAEVGVRVVDAGVDDADPDALAGLAAALPDCRCTDERHRRGVGRGLGRDAVDRLDAGDGGEGLQACSHRCALRCRSRSVRTVEGARLGRRRREACLDRCLRPLDGGALVAGRELGSRATTRAGVDEGRRRGRRVELDHHVDRARGAAERTVHLLGL